MEETYIKNHLYKNVNSSSYIDNHVFNKKTKFIIYYNNSPYFVVDTIEQANDYINKTIQDLYSDMCHTNFQLYDNLQIIHCDNGAEIIENNPFYIFNYDNSIISLKFLEVNSI
tara:strand:+ start:541 stop:879 length:339 start_codon:yes stop_codon:yes gene_type:complete